MTGMFSCLLAAFALTIALLAAFAAVLYTLLHRYSLLNHYNPINLVGMLCSCVLNSLTW